MEENHKQIKQVLFFAIFETVFTLLLECRYDKMNAKIQFLND